MLEISASSSTKISDVNELKRLIKNELAHLNHSVIDRVAGDLAQASICYCGRSGEEHFEHMM